MKMWITFLGVENGCVGVLFKHKGHEYYLRKELGWVTILLICFTISLKMTTITEIINHLKDNADKVGIKLHEGASPEKIKYVEDTYKITLPDDFKEFYGFSDGFESIDNLIFNLLTLDEMLYNEHQYKYNNQNLAIAEYLIYSDEWVLLIDKTNSGSYQLLNGNHNSGYLLTLTTSFAEFLMRFIKGGLFDSGGLYDWYDDIFAANLGLLRCGKFTIKQDFKITGRSFVIAGEIDEGEITPGDVTFINDRQIRITGVEFGHAPKHDWVCLLLETFKDIELETKITSLAGATINIYRS